MVKEARELVRKGELGEPPEGGCGVPARLADQSNRGGGPKTSSWRTNPEQAGASSCVGDIGTHAENLARYITGTRDRRAMRRFHYLR